MTTAASAFGRALSRAALVLIALVLLPYAWGPVYRFPEPFPFEGPKIWNPYQSLTGTWQRANLHAHGRAWGGLTTGEQPDEAVAKRYSELGYSVPGVSDYQYIAAFDGVNTMPLYEHGYNAGKNHQLAIGAHKVDWFDFPLWQSASNQQYVIDRVKSKADLVALNHPMSRDAYGASAMRSLTGYNLIEIANGPFTAEDVWDAALSSGRPVWGLANDDTHDLTDVRRTAVAWTMIDAASGATADVVSALRAGRSYAVLRTGAIEAAGITALSSVTVHDSTVTVSLHGAPSLIEFVGQDGIIRKGVKDTLSASYTLTAADTYVRPVVNSPQTILYLNPVLRWDGAHFPAPAASVDAALTWTQRGATIAACVALLLWRRSRRVDASLAASSTPVARRA